MSSGSKQRSKAEAIDSPESCAFRLDRTRLRDWLVSKVRRVAAHLEPMVLEQLQRAAAASPEENVKCRAHACATVDSLRIFSRYVPDEVLDELVRETSATADTTAQEALRTAIADAQLGTNGNVNVARPKSSAPAKKSRTSVALEKDAIDSKKITSFFTKK